MRGLLAFPRWICEVYARVRGAPPLASSRSHRPNTIQQNPTLQRPFSPQLATAKRSAAGSQIRNPKSKIQNPEVPQMSRNVPKCPTRANEAAKKNLRNEPNFDLTNFKSPLALAIWIHGFAAAFMLVEASWNIAMVYSSCLSSPIVRTPSTTSGSVE